MRPRITSIAQLLSAVIIALLSITQPATAQSAKTPTTEELNRETVYRRAVDAVIWGLPIVGEDTVKQAAFRDGKATYNDIVWWPTPLHKQTGWQPAVTRRSRSRH